MRCFWKESLWGWFTNMSILRFQGQHENKESYINLSEHIPQEGFNLLFSTYLDISDDLSLWEICVMVLCFLGIDLCHTSILVCKKNKNKTIQARIQKKKHLGVKFLKNIHTLCKKQLCVVCKIYLHQLLNLNLNIFHVINL